MRRRRLHRLCRLGRVIGPAAAAVVAVVAATPVMTAANSVPQSGVADVRLLITVDDLKPAECGGIVVTNLVMAANGTSQNDLVIGTAEADNLNGRVGDDCILGGGGDDRLTGAQGTDVCLGGPGADAFNPSCETAID